MKKLKGSAGNPVEGDQFWGREAELRSFIELLDGGANVLLTAPRRIGKTSLMRQTERTVDARYYCLRVDLQQANDPADAIVELAKATYPHQKLWQKTTGVFGNILGSILKNIEKINLSEVGVTIRGGLAAGNWQAKGDELFQTLAKADRPVIIFFDEVPILVTRILKGTNQRPTPEGRQEADRFVSWLRANALAHSGRVRQVITGSIGLEPLLRKVGLSAAINHCHPFHLGAWDSPTAVACLHALAAWADLSFEPQAAERVTELLGYCVPFHIQVFFDNLKQECRHRGTSGITASFVDEVYRTRMLSVRGHADLSHLEERLKLAFERETHQLALEFLTEAAITGRLTAQAIRILSTGIQPPDGTSIPEIVREILEILEHDGYLERGGDGYRFCSNLLRDWWKSRFETFFIPASERGAAQ